MLRLSLFAAASSASVIRHEDLYGNGWTKSALPVAGSNALRFTIVCNEQNLDQVKQIALDVNDPTSSNYGNFLSQDKLDGLTAPKASDLSAVTDWLGANGLAYEMKGVSNIEVTTTVFRASKLLSTVSFQPRALTAAIIS